MLRYKARALPTLQPNFGIFFKDDIPQRPSSTEGGVAESLHNATYIILTLQCLLMEASVYNVDLWWRSLDCDPYHVVWSWYMTGQIRMLLTSCPSPVTLYCIAQKCYKYPMATGTKVSSSMTDI